MVPACCRAFECSSLENNLDYMGSLSTTANNLTCKYWSDFVSINSTLSNLDDELIDGSARKKKPFNSISIFILIIFLISIKV